MQGDRRNSFRIAGIAGAAVALALLALPAGAAAANPPACDTSVYPTPWLVFDGTTVRSFTRYIELRQNRHSNDNSNASGDADVEYPFSVKVNKSNGTSRTFTVHDYARDQFPTTFGRGQTAVASATYVENHTEYSALGSTLHVRCTRTVTASFKRPKKKKNQGGEGEDHDQGQGQGENEGDDS
jgi:hypothetical protein